MRAVVLAVFFAFLPLACGDDARLFVLPVDGGVARTARDGALPRSGIRGVCTLRDVSGYHCGLVYFARDEDIDCNAPCAGFDRRTCGWRVALPARDLPVEEIPPPCEDAR